MRLGLIQRYSSDCLVLVQVDNTEVNELEGFGMAGILAQILWRHTLICDVQSSVTSGNLMTVLSLIQVLILR